MRCTASHWASLAAGAQVVQSSHMLAHRDMQQGAPLLERVPVVVHSEELARGEGGAEALARLALRVCHQLRARLHVRAARPLAAQLQSMRVLSGLCSGVRDRLLLSCTNSMCEHLLSCTLLARPPSASVIGCVVASTSALHAHCCLIAASHGARAGNLKQRPVQLLA